MWTRIKRNVLLGVFVFFVAIGLTGCFKGEISVDVKGSGSGMIGIAFGMTQEAKALLSSQTGDGQTQSTNPLEQIQKSLGEGIGLPGGVKVSNWVEGEYEWAKVEKEVKNVDEINQALAGNKIFKSFSLTRKEGFFQNEFILNAELSSLSDDEPSSTSSIQIDPSAFIQMRFALRLPGKIEETNGLVDATDPNRMVWTMQGSQSVSIKARSVAWNWVNIILIAGIGGVIILAGTGGMGFWLYKSARMKKPLPVTQQVTASAEEAIFQADDSLASLGIENLLRQVNERALKNSGQFFNQPGEIVLTWTDASEHQKFIAVKDLGQDKISINGQIYPATKENAKQGILNALKS